MPIDDPLGQGVRLCKKRLVHQWQGGPHNYDVHTCKDRPQRSVLCHLLHLSRFWRERICPAWAGEIGAVVKAACLESRRSQVRTSLWPSIFKQTKCFFPAHLERFNIVGSLCDREVAFSTSDRQGLNLQSCVWSAVSSHSSHNPQEVTPVNFSLYVHKGGLTHHSFYFIMNFFF